MENLRILFLMESVDLSGGVSVILNLANLLKKKGLLVKILAKYGNTSWFCNKVNIEYTDNLYNPQIDNSFKPNIVIGTFYTTINPLKNYKSAKLFHFCQGYEGSYEFYKNKLSEIEEAYDTNIDKIVIAKWLQPFLTKKFNKKFNTHYIGQIVDKTFFSSPIFFLKRFLPKKEKTILVTGPLSFKEKGVGMALRSLAYLKKRGYNFKLIRVSYIENSKLKEEKIIKANKYYINLTKIEMKKVYKKTDILLTTPTIEGFGLPLAEAMSMGIPVVASAIEPYLTEYDCTNHVLFGTTHSPKAYSEKIQTLLDSHKNYISAIIRGKTCILNYCKPTEVCDNFLKIVIGE